MKTLGVSLLCSLLLLCSQSGVAQQEAGDMELQFQGLYFTTVGTDFTFGSGTISAKIGPFITDNFQIGVGPTLTITTMTDISFDPVTLAIKKESKTTTTFGSTVFIVYSILLRDAKAVPYFGGTYFKSDFSDSDDKGSMGISAGLKYYFTKRTAFDFSGNYLFSLNTDTEGGILLFGFGLSFLF